MLPCIVYHGLKLGAKSSIKIMSIKPYSLKKVGKYWHYDFRVNGERYRGSTKAVSKELAVRYADNYYLEVYEAGSNLSNEKKDIKSFIVEHVRQGLHSLSPDWLYTKERTLEKFRDFLHGMRVYELSEIQLEHLEAYKTLQLEKNKPSSAQNTMEVIGTMLRHAVKHDYIRKNPALQLSKIKGIEKNKKRFLSKTEVIEVIDATKGTYLETLVLVAIYSGLRRRELIHLEFSDVDYKKKLLYVRNKEGYQTKSRKERVLPLHRKLWSFFKGKSEGICFPYEGRIIQEDTASRNFKTMMTNAGLDDVGLHTLRHTFVSHCLMSGVSMWEVSRWAGHSSSYVTELYGHLEPDRREIDRLNL